MLDSQNTYFIDPTNGAEVARLIDQEHLFTKAVGGLLPIEIDPDHITTVLNLGCGPGEWEHEVAFQYPHMMVVGVDLSEAMVKYARAMTRVTQLDNVTFEVMDVKKPLDFPDSSFDMINGRLLFGFMNRESWPLLLAECLRVLRPGGVLCLTEYEVSISNSPALQSLLLCLYRALTEQRRTFSVDRRSIGICHMLEKLLKGAGFASTVGRAFHIDSSYGKPCYASGCRDTETALTLLKPYLVQAGVIEEAEYEALHYQMQMEMMGENFVNVSFGLQVWGYKP